MSINPELISALVEASQKIQAAHYVAKRTGNLDVALRLKDAGMRVAGALARAARDCSETKEIANEN